MTEDPANECSVVHCATTSGSEMVLDPSEFNRKSILGLFLELLGKRCSFPGRDRGPELPEAIFLNTQGKPT